MRASEILRKLADVIDSQEAGDMSNSQQAIQAAHPNVRVALAPAEQPAAEQPQVAVTTFVPPLQTKIELLKKAVDVDSIYDEGGDELAQMKKRAGINPVVADEAASDEPLDI
jgi:hypothetical protein